jgi:hypothetical protein
MKLALTKVETEAILCHALGPEAPDEIIEQIHLVTGGNFHIYQRTVRLQQMLREY